MRENRTYGSEGGESGSTGLPYPYNAAAGFAAIDRRWSGRELEQVLGLVAPEF
jgi:hypothetical protein